MGEIQSVCVLSLLFQGGVNKLSEELVFRQHFIGQLLWQGVCYILDFLRCIPLQALWLRTTRERMLGADAVLDLDGVLVPGVVLQTSFGNDVSRAGKKKRNGDCIVTSAFVQLLGQHTIVLEIFLCKRTCEFHP